MPALTASMCNKPGEAFGAPTAHLDDGSSRWLTFLDELLNAQCSAFSAQCSVPNTYSVFNIARCSNGAPSSKTSSLLSLSAQRSVLTVAQPTRMGRRNALVYRCPCFRGADLFALRAIHRSEAGNREEWRDNKCQRVRNGRDAQKEPDQTTMPANRAGYASGKIRTEAVGTKEILQLSTQ